MDLAHQGRICRSASAIVPRKCRGFWSKVERLSPMSFGGCYAIHRAGQATVDRGSTIQTVRLLIQVVVARGEWVSGHHGYLSTIAWPNRGGSRMHTVPVQHRCDATHVHEKPTARQDTYPQILCQQQPLLEQPSSVIKIRNGKRAITVKRP